MAIILKKQLGMPLWLTNTAINVPLFAAAARLKGWKFIRRTLVATVALSVSLYVIPEIPFLMDDLLLTALFGGIITGAGAGIVFACQATTGGTDMLAALIRRWMPHYTIAQIMQVLDAIIVLIGAGVFGITYALYALIAIYSVSKVSDAVIVLIGAGIFGVTYALYALIAIYAVSKVSDGIIEGMKYSKVAYIISDKSKEIAAAILKEMDRGVTALDARGMYSGNRKDVLFCVVSRKEIAQLKELVVGHDAQAFVIVSDAREVLGEGFIEYRQ